MEEEEEEEEEGEEEEEREEEPKVGRGKHWRLSRMEEQNQKRQSNSRDNRTLA